jgi:hypothetical protein
MIKTWKIYNIERTLPEGLVIKVTYGCVVDSTNFQTRKVGNIDLIGDVNDPGFIPYDDLTEIIVIDWVKTELGVLVTTIEAGLESELQIKEDALAGKTTEDGLPWV